MCGWSQLVSGHKEATSYPQTHVSATVCVLWRLLWPWDKVVLEVGSPESHLVKFTGH